MDKVWNVLKHTFEVALIGAAVTLTGAAIEGLSNYHPTGEAASVWGFVGVIMIGALKGLLSDLISQKKLLTEEQEEEDKS